MCETVLNLDYIDQNIISQMINAKSLIYINWDIIL